MKHFHNATLLPKFEDGLIYKFQMFFKSFMINVGIYKTFMFFALIGISYYNVQAILILQNGLLNQMLSIGEYINGIFSISIMILISIIYQFYYIDKVLEWALKSEDRIK